MRQPFVQNHESAALSISVNIRSVVLDQALYAIGHSKKCLRFSCYEACMRPCQRNNLFSVTYDFAFPTIPLSLIQRLARRDMKAQQIVSHLFPELQ